MIAEALVRSALEGGVVALIAWLVVRAFPAIRPDTRVWIWRLVFAKFLLGLIPVANVVLPILPDRYAPAPAHAIAHDHLATSATTAATGIGATPSALPPQIDPLTIAFIVWGAVVLALIVLNAVDVVRGQRLIADAEPVRNPFAIAQFHAICHRAGLRKPPALLLSDTIESAMLIGGWSPSIVLPREILADDRTEDRKLVLAHEVAHLVRRDLWWDASTRLVQVLFFFHPAVWIAAWESSLARESAADEWALKISGVSAHGYADMLFRATVQLPVRSPLALSREPGVLGMLESHRALERRLKAMKHFTKEPTSNKWLASAGLTLLAFTILPAYRLAPANWFQDQTAAGKNLKQLGVALLYYTSDYDDVLPNPQSTHALQYILWPYTKDKRMWDTYNPTGSQFKLARNLGGVHVPDIANPDSIPMIYETKPWPDGARWVEFGSPFSRNQHAAEVPLPPDRATQLIAGDDWKSVEKKLTIKYPISAKPLPMNYGDDWTPPDGGQTTTPALRAGP
jgi:beta-lactamase regulating signal transducer with metallopeptidase domain